MQLILYDIEIKNDPHGIRIRLVRALRRAGAFQLQRSAWLLQDINNGVLKIIDEFREAGGSVKIVEWLPRTLEEVTGKKNFTKNVVIAVNGAEPIIEGWHTRIQSVLNEIGYKVICQPISESAVAQYSKETGKRYSLITAKESISKHLDESAISDLDAMILLNSGRSTQSGIVFGAQAISNTKILYTLTSLPLLQIERPGKDDGVIIVWNDSAQELAMKMAKYLDMPIITPSLEAKLVTVDGKREIRQIHFANIGDRIIINGKEVGVCLTDRIFIITQDGKLIDIMGGKITKKFTKRLQIGPISTAIVKTIPN